MPYYWDWLYRPKQVGETEEDKILRKLSFKLPVVVRYNFIFAFFFGILGGFYTKKMSTIIYFYRYTPIGIVGLCYEEVIRYYRWKTGQ
jgi:hypothetical protein